MDKDNQELLVRGAGGLGVFLGPRELALLDQYLALLQKWSRAMNLTGVRDERDQVIKLLLDSLAVVPVLGDNMRVMDLGSGAGLPGLPVKIALPGLEMVLVESRQKRAAFLKQAVLELGLSRTEVFQGRAEDLSKVSFSSDPDSSKGQERSFVLEGDKKFHAILARAVGELGDLARVSSALLATEGLLIAMKGPDPGAELDNNKEILEAKGLWLRKVKYYDLPESAGKRSLIILKKSSVT